MRMPVKPDPWPSTDAIASSFSRGRDSYQRSCFFHRRLAEGLLSSWPEEGGGGRMLEIGSHEGMFTAMLKQRWPGRSLVTLDLQKLGTSGAPHVRGDGEHLPFRHGAFKLVVSGSTFQWFRRPGPSMAAILEALPEGGALGFTQFLRPSLEPMASVMAGVAGPGRFLPLMSADELKGLVEPLGKVLHWSVLEDRLHFAQMNGLHRFLKDMGVGAPSKGLKALFDGPGPEN